MASKEYRVPSSPAVLRMVLVGETGSGKSAAGNTILGRECFESEMSPESVTKECQIGQGEFKGKTISVTDTPCMCDKDLTEEALSAAFNRFIYMTVPGPHVFLLVIRVGVTYSREDKDAVQWICENFGKEALQHAIILFTHTDELKDTPLDQYVNASDDLLKLKSDCGDRFHELNNNDKNPNQVTQLLQKIECMVESNRQRGREYYTNDVYKRAQKRIDAIDVVLVVISCAGVIGHICTKLLVRPGLIGAGSLAAVVLLVKKYYEHRQRRDHRKIK